MWKYNEATGKWEWIGQENKQNQLRDRIQQIVSPGINIPEAVRLTQEKEKWELENPGLKYEDVFGDKRGYQPATPAFTQERVVGEQAEKLEEFTKKTQAAPSIYADVDDLFGETQSWSDKWANGTLKFAGKTLTATAGGLAMIPGLLYGAATGSFSNVYDNDFQRMLDRANEAMDEALPNYVRKEVEDYSILQKMGTHNFWANDVLSGMSFVAGAVLTEYLSLGIASSAIPGMASRFLRTGLKAGSKVEDASKAFRTLGMTAKETADVAGAVRRLGTGTFYESGVEARHFANEARENYIQDFIEQNGREPSEVELSEAMSKIYNVANGVFGLNTALVGLSNLVVLPKTFGPKLLPKLASRLTGNTADDVGKGLIKTAELSPTQLKFAAKKLKLSIDEVKAMPFIEKSALRTKTENILRTTYGVLKRPVTEGIFEEMLQGSVNKAGLDYVAKYLDTESNLELADIGISFMKGLEETYGSQEGWEEGVIGMIIGGIGLPGKSSTGKGIAMQGGVWDALRDPLKTQRLEYIERAKNMSSPERIKALIEYAVSVKKAANKYNDALELGDILSAKSAEHESFFSLVNFKMKLNDYQSIEDEINQITSEYADDQFALLFGYENANENEIAKRKNELKEALLKRARNTKNNILKAQRYTGKEDLALRDALAYNFSSVENLDERIDSLKNSLLSITTVSPEETAELLKANTRIKTTSTILTKYKEKIEELNKEKAALLEKQLDPSSTEDTIKKYEAKVKTVEESLDKMIKDEYSKKEKSKNKNFTFLQNKTSFTEFLDRLSKLTSDVDAYVFENPDQKEEVIRNVKDLERLVYQRESFVSEISRLLTKDGQKEFNDAFEEIRKQNASNLNSDLKFWFDAGIATAGQPLAQGTTVRDVQKALLRQQGIRLQNAGFAATTTDDLSEEIQNNIPKAESATITLDEEQSKIFTTNTVKEWISDFNNNIPANYEDSDSVEQKIDKLKKVIAYLEKKNKELDSKIKEFEGTIVGEEFKTLKNTESGENIESKINSLKAILEQLQEIKTSLLSKSKAVVLNPYDLFKLNRSFLSEEEQKEVDSLKQGDIYNNSYFEFIDYTPEGNDIISYSNPKVKLKKGAVDYPGKALALKVNVNGKEIVVGYLLDPKRFTIDNQQIDFTNLIHLQELNSEFVKEGKITVEGENFKNFAFEIVDVFEKVSTQGKVSLKDNYNLNKTISHNTIKGTEKPLIRDFLYLPEFSIPQSFFTTDKGESKQKTFSTPVIVSNRKDKQFFYVFENGVWRVLNKDSESARISSLEAFYAKANKDGLTGQFFILANTNNYNSKEKLFSISSPFVDNTIPIEDSSFIIDRYIDLINQQDAIEKPERGVTLTDAEGNGIFISVLDSKKEEETSSSPTLSLVVDKLKYPTLIFEVGPDKVIRVRLHLRVKNGKLEGSKFGKFEGADVIPINTTEEFITYINAKLKYKLGKEAVNFNINPDIKVGNFFKRLDVIKEDSSTGEVQDMDQFRSNVNIKITYNVTPPNLTIAKKSSTNVATTTSTSAIKNELNNVVADAINSINTIEEKIYNSSEFTEQVENLKLFIKNENLSPTDKTAYINAINQALSNRNKQLNDSTKDTSISITPDKKAKKAEKPVINIYWGSPESSTNTKVLSNLAPRKFTYQGKEYGSVEHAYQTLKSGSFDQDTYNKYVKAGGYGTKIRGKAVQKSFDNLQLMRDLVVESFKQNPEQAKLLLNYSDFTHTTNEVIDRAFLDGIRLAQKNAELASLEEAKPTSITVSEETSDVTSLLASTLTEEPKTEYTPEEIQSLQEEYKALNLKNFLGQTTEEDLKRIEVLKNILFPKDSNKPNENTGPVFSVSETPAKDVINLDVATQNLMRILNLRTPENPSGVFSLQDVKNIMSNVSNNGITWGAYLNKAIYLSKEAGKGTEYHEAFHAIFRSLLSPKQINSYYYAAAKEYGTPTAQELLKLKSSSSAFTNLSMNELKRLWLEEKMAEAFKDYAVKKDEEKTKEKPKGILRILFDKIKKLIGLIKRNKTDLDILFEDIYNGKFKNVAPVNTIYSFTAPAFALLEKPKTLGYNNEVETSYLNTTQTNRIISLVASEALALQSTQGTLSQEDIYKTIDEVANTKYNPATYKNELLALSEKDPNRAANIIDKIKTIQDSLTTIQKNRDLIVEEVKKKLALYNIESEEEMSLQEYIENETPERAFDSNIAEIGGFTSLSKGMREFISFTPEYVDEFGFGEFADLNDTKFKSVANAMTIYTGVERVLAGISPVNMLDRLALFAKSNSNAKAFYNHLISQINNELASNGIQNFDASLDPTNIKVLNNSTIFTAFSQAFNKDKVSFVVAVYDPKSGIVKAYKSNVKDDGEVQIDEWFKNFEAKGLKNSENNKTIFNRIKELFAAETINQTEITLEGGIVIESFDDRVEMIKREFEKLGFKISSGYIKHSLIEKNRNLIASNIITSNAQIKPFFEDLLKTYNAFNDVEGISIDDLEALSQSNVARNPFSDVDEDAALGRLKRIAQNNSVFDESVSSTTFQNSEGKTIYSYIQPSFYHREIAKWNRRRNSAKELLNAIKDNVSDSEGAKIIQRMLQEEGTPYEIYFAKSMYRTIKFNPYLLGIYNRPNRNSREDSERFTDLVLENLYIFIIDGTRTASLAEKTVGDEDIIVEESYKGSTGVSFGNMTSQGKLLQPLLFFAKQKGNKLRKAQKLYPERGEKKITEDNSIETTPYLISINSDKSTQNVVSGPILKTTKSNLEIEDVTIEYLLAGFKQEFYRIQQAVKEIELLKQGITVDEDGDTILEIKNYHYKFDKKGNKDYTKGRSLDLFQDKERLKILDEGLYTKIVNLAKTNTDVNAFQEIENELKVFIKNNLAPYLFNEFLEYLSSPANKFIALDVDNTLKATEQTKSQEQGKKINFQEDQNTGYAARTRINASADATIAIAVDFNSAGEKLTKNSVIEQGKKYIPRNLDEMFSSVDPFDLNKGYELNDKFIFQIAEGIVMDLNSVNAKTLNIAGNGIYTMKGKYSQDLLDQAVERLLEYVIYSDNLKNKIVSIRTGGQTGIDEAGAKAGIKLGVSTTILAPKNWKFRDVTGKDISNEQQFKQRFNEIIKENLEFKEQSSVATQPTLTQNPNYKNKVLPEYFTTTGDYVDLQILSEFYFNDLINSASIFNLLNGDLAMLYKDLVDVIKRNAKGIAAGPPLGIGETRIAVIKSIAARDRQEFGKEVLGSDIEKLEEQDTTDGQNKCTLDWYTKKYLTATAKYPLPVKNIYKKIQKGYSLTAKEVRELRKFEALANPKKIVVGDRFIYNKMSMKVLLRSETSYCRPEDRDTLDFLYDRLEEAKLNENYQEVAAINQEIHKLWKPIPSNTANHFLLNALETDNIDVIAYDSAFKNAIPNLGEITGNVEQGFNVTLNPFIVADEFFKEQVKTDNIKSEIVDPTQLLNTIFSEQNPNLLVKVLGVDVSVKEVIDTFFKLVSSRTEIGLKELRQAIFDNDVPKYKHLLKMFKESLMLTGADPYLIEMVSSVEGDANSPKFNLNMPNTIDKIESMFLAFIQKNTLKFKASGTKATLVSDFGYGVMEYVDEETGKTTIITATEFRDNVEKYEGKVTSRRLKFGKKDSNGNFYSEILISAQTAEQLNLKPGDTLPEELLEMFGVRIPTQDKHSMGYFKVVGSLPGETGNQIVMPYEILKLSGADFDIDSEYLRTLEYFLKGKEIMWFGKYLKASSDIEALRLARQEYIKEKSESYEVKDKKKSILSNSVQYKEALRSINSYKQTAREAFKLDKEILNALENIFSETENLIEENNVVSEVSLVEQLASIIELTKEQVQIQNSTKEFIDVIKELNKKLKTIEDEATIEALEYVGYPVSKTAFKEAFGKTISDNRDYLKNNNLSKITPITIGEINNLLVPITGVLIMNESNQEVTKTITSVDSFDSYEERLAKEGIKDVTKLDGIFDATSKHKAAVSNSVGKENIGPGAVFTLLFQRLHRAGVNFQKEYITKVAETYADSSLLPSIFSKNFELIVDKNGQIKNESGERINSLIDQIIAAMTDNAKDPKAAKHNLSYSLLGAALLRIGLGEKFDTTISLQKQPVMVEFSNELSYSRSGLSDKNLSKSKILKGIKEKYKAKLKQGVSVDITDDVLIEALKYANDPTSTKLTQEEFDYIQFYTINEMIPSIQIGDILRNFSSLISLSRGLKPTFSENYDVYTALDSLGLEVVLTNQLDPGNIDSYTIKHTKNFDKKKEDYPVDFLNLVKNDPILSNYIKTFHILMKDSSKFFILETELAKKTLKILENNYPEGTFNFENRRKESRRNLLSFLSTHAYRKIAGIYENNEFFTLDSLFSKIVNGVEEKPLHIQLFEKLSANPNFENNTILKSLTVETIEYKENNRTGLKGKTLYKLVFNSRTKNNPDFVERLVDSFKELMYSKDIDAKNFAINAFMYLLKKDAGAFKKDTFIRQIAPIFLLRVSQGLDKIQEQLNSKNPNLTSVIGMSNDRMIHEFVELFMRHSNNVFSMQSAYAANFFAANKKSEIVKEIQETLKKENIEATEDNIKPFLAQEYYPIFSDINKPGVIRIDLTKGIPQEKLNSKSLDKDSLKILGINKGVLLSAGVFSESPDGKINFPPFFKILTQTEGGANIPTYYKLKTLGTGIFFNLDGNGQPKVDNKYIFDADSSNLYSFENINGYHAIYEVTTPILSKEIAPWAFTLNEVNQFNSNNEINRNINERLQSTQAPEVTTNSSTNKPVLSLEQIKAGFSLFTSPAITTTPTVETKAEESPFKEQPQEKGFKEKVLDNINNHTNWDSPEKKEKVLEFVNKIFNLPLNDNIKNSVNAYLEAEKISTVKESKSSVSREINQTTLTNTLNKLSNKFGIKWVYDTSIPGLGQFKNGVVLINPNKAKADTPFHEFAHPFIAIVKVQNPALYNNLKNQLINSEIGQKTLAKVQRLYPELSTEAQIEEAIVDVIGQYAANQDEIKKEKGLWNAIKTFLRRVSEYLKDLLSNSNKKVIPSELDPNTTLEEIATMLVIDNPVDVLSRKFDNYLQKKSSTNIASTIYELIPNISEAKIDEIYKNYVSLMGIARKNKEISKESFENLLKSYQVFNYKDTYIFGNYDNQSGVFITRLNSSPSSKELLAEALPTLVKQGIDFASFVPKDVATKYERSGYFISTKGFDYNFKGEDMVKYLAVSNPNISLKIFGKSLDKLSKKEIQDYNKNVELKYTPVEIKGDLIEKAGKDVSKIFELYLNQFGIKVKDIDEIKNNLNIDELGFADILSKIAYVKNKKDLPPIAGEFIAYMMQYNPLVSDIITELSQTKSYKNLDKNKYFKIIGELIANDLQNKLEGNYSKSLLDKLKQLIKEFFSLLNNTPIDLINKNIGIISNNILQQNKKLITASLYKPGAFGKPTKQVSLQEAMDSDKFGASIINSIAKKGFILTGSTSLGEQGTIQRPDENLLHDIDWVSPFNRQQTEELFKEVYPEAIKIRDIYGEGYITDTWIITPEGYSIINLKKTGEYNIISSYEIVDKNNKVVGTYKLEKQKETNQTKEVVTGIEAKIIDFFSYDTYNQESPFEKNNIKLANWKEIFKAKLNFARYKDIWDYNRFIPNENAIEIAKQKESIKPGVEELFESNPKLANEVYEALGFNNINSNFEIINEAFNTESGEGVILSLKYKGELKNNIPLKNREAKVKATYTYLKKLRDKEIEDIKSLKGTINSDGNLDVGNGRTVYIKRLGLSSLEDYKKYALSQDFVTKTDKELLERAEKEISLYEDIEPITEIYLSEDGSISGNLGTVGIKIPSQIIGKGFGKDAYRTIARYLQSKNKTLKSDVFGHSESAHRVWESLRKLGEAKIIKGNQNDFDGKFYTAQYEYIGNTAQITPQQKQQAQQLYSQYLDTIFPDSKVKDIVYHGSNQKINQFEVRKEPLIHFGSKNAALNRGNVLTQTVLNIKNLQTIKDGMWFLGTDEGGLLKELLDRNILTIEEVKSINKVKNDAIQQSPYFHENYRMAIPDGEKAGNKKLQEILGNKDIGFEYINFSEDKGSTSYAVPSQKQIHILGSKQDIEGFKEFVNQASLNNQTVPGDAATLFNNFVNTSTDDVIEAIDNCN